jgi:hypothetical protein
VPDAHGPGGGAEDVRHGRTLVRRPPIQSDLGAAKITVISSGSPHYRLVRTRSLPQLIDQTWADPG